ncbi:MAG: 4-hydroxy-tetrahydrodipicolinate reductase [Brachymonas sp.]
MICIAGAGGRMGRMLIEAVTQAPDCRLGGALDIPGSAGIGLDASGFLGTASGMSVTSDVAQALKGCDFLIDFTRPEGTMAHLAECRRQGVRMVIGTTGFSEEQKKELQAASKDIAIMLAPNMSVGVNVTLKLLELAAKSLSSGYDIEVIETHHRHKVDAPSGTALKMGEVIANALGRDLQGHAVFAREGITGARDPLVIGFSAIRGGDVVGDHTVMFAGIGERIEITHKSSTRQGYAEGALRAVRFLADKKSGMFDMFDVLGLNG